MMPQKKQIYSTTFFRNQTILNDHNIKVPHCPTHNVLSELDSLVLDPEEVLPILKPLPVGKAVGPVGVSNRNLKELADQIGEPLTCLLNQSLAKVLFLRIGKNPMLVLFLKMTTPLYLQTIDSSHY